MWSKKGTPLVPQPNGHRNAAIVLGINKEERGVILGILFVPQEFSFGTNDFDTHVVRQGLSFAAVHIRTSLGS